LGLGLGELQGQGSRARFWLDNLVKEEDEETESPITEGRDFPP